MRSLLFLLLCVTVALCRRPDRFNRRRQPQFERYEYDWADQQPHRRQPPMDHEFGWADKQPPMDRHSMHAHDFVPHYMLEELDNIVEDQPPPPAPSPPAEPLNPVLSALSQLPLPLYNNYICNMFRPQYVSPNINYMPIRNRRYIFGNGYFRMLRDYRRVVNKAYMTLKMFAPGSDNDLLDTIQNVAMNMMDPASPRGLQLEDVIQTIIANKLNADGVVGNAKDIYEAIKELSNQNPQEIQDSTQEAVDMSCGAINNEFYCNYMKKLADTSECSSQYFSTEILDTCCADLVNEVLPITEVVTELPVVATTVKPIAEFIAALTAATTASPTTAAPTAAPTTAAPTAAPTTAAPTAAPIAATTTAAPQPTCGVSTVNAATRFADFSSAMNQVRIVGGVNTEKCEYPWMVRLQVGNSLCGGSIIDATHILTAGHCIGTNTASDITVHAGEYDYNVLDSVDKTHTVSKVDVHSNYTEFPTGGVDNDVAILTLDTPLTYNSCIQPICLPKATDPAITAGTQCVVAGWGTTSSGGQTSNILKEVIVPTYSGADCASVFSSTVPTNTETQICGGRPVIGGADSCQGDSGGPLFCAVNGVYVQYGVVSYGSGCADAGAAGIYADVIAMSSFIDQIVNQ